MPKLPHLASFNAKKQPVYSELQMYAWASHPISKPKPSNYPEEFHFGHICHYLDLTTMGEGQILDVNYLSISRCIFSSLVNKNPRYSWIFLVLAKSNQELFDLGKWLPPYPEQATHYFSSREPWPQISKCWSSSQQLHTQLWTFLVDEEGHWLRANRTTT